MATCSSIFAWKIPWTEEPGSSTGVQRVRHYWAAPPTHRIILWSPVLKELKFSELNPGTISLPEGVSSVAQSEGICTMKEHLKLWRIFHWGRVLAWVSLCLWYLHIHFQARRTSLGQVRKHGIIHCVGKKKYIYIYIYICSFFLQASRLLSDHKWWQVFHGRHRIWREQRALM